jgi:hypothetical protein
MSAKDYLKSPAVIFIIYLVVSFLFIMLFQFLFPTEDSPLAVYAFIWRCTQGLADFLSLLPALILAGLLIPFGLLYYYDDNFSVYSARFLDLMKRPIVTALSAALLYVCSVFLFIPLTQQSLKTMRSQARLFTEAKEKIQIHIAQLEWSKALPFITICSRIWPDNPDINALLETVNIIDEKSVRPAPPFLRSVPYISPQFPVGQQPVTAAQALTMAQAALDEERYYDAHWLATLALRLAPDKSTEHPQAAALAARAWQAIGVVPKPEDYAFYNMKRDGYEACLAENWVKAHSILSQLIRHIPDDTEVNHFLAITLNEIQTHALFVDELEGMKVQTLMHPLFSVPDTESGGRFIIRMNRLSINNEYAYGWNTAVMALDSAGRVRFEAQATYSKIIPLLTGDKPHIRLILQALDRYNADSRWDPVFSPAEFAQGDLTFAMGYDDFLALARLSTSTVDQLSIPELLAAVRKYSPFGYLKPVFYAELLYRFIEAMLFMPITILILVMGWRYRARRRPYAFIIVFALIAPVIFTVLLSCYRGILNTTVIAVLVSLGFPLSAVLFTAADIVLFICSLVMLAKS